MTGHILKPWLLAAAFGFLRASASASDPVSLPNSGLWDGIDGSWSTFNLRIGSPAQDVRVYASWQSYQTWVILPQGCPAADTASSCSGDRGGLFNPNESTSWDNHGFFALTIEENLGVYGNAQYGWDTVALGAEDEAITVQVQNSTVAGLAVNDYYLGLLGLDPKPTNWSSYTDQSPSLMSMMKDQDLIPSISFGYNAGAQWRNIGGSLTIGGYDSSRFVENDVTFKFGSDNARYTVVNVRSITTPEDGSSGRTSELLGSSIFALIDTTVAEFWLPEQACQAFESEFGLKYDETSDLYLVDDSTHSALAARNASISFTLGPDSTSGSTIDIVIPYSAFDLTANAPYAGLSSSSRYFPLRRAANDTQYTLGRAFMQEAYISVDYSLQEFNVSQASWDFTGTTLVTVPQSQPLTGAFATVKQGLPPNKTTPLKRSAIAGIAIGAIASFAAIAVFLVWYFRRRQQRKRTASALWSAPSEKHASSHRSRGGPFDDVSSASDDSRTVFSAGGSSYRHDGSRIYAKYADSPTDMTRSPVSEDKVMSPYSTSSVSSPHTPFSARGGGSSYFSNNHHPKSSLISPSTPQDRRTQVPLLAPPVIWAGEKDSGQIFEMPGSVPQVAQADSRELSPVEARDRRSPSASVMCEKDNDIPSSSAAPFRSPRTSSLASASARTSITPSHPSAVVPRLNLGNAARDTIASPVSALTPSSRRMRGLTAEGYPEHISIMGRTSPRSTAIAEEDLPPPPPPPPPPPQSSSLLSSPQTARTPRQKVPSYGIGDDDEYQSPAF